MKLTGYYMTAICKFEDIVDMRNLLNLADMDGVI